MAGREALRRAGLEPAVLEAKEGLALVNGTRRWRRLGALALLDAEQVLRIGSVACAMTVEG